MGTSGVPLNIPKSVIIDTLKREKGRISYACKALDICSQSLRNLINADPELIELLSILRHDFETALLDKAESTLIYAMEQNEKDLTNSLKSTFFVLNNKGKPRGYFPPTYKQSEEGSIDEVRGAIQAAQDDARNRTLSRSELEAEPSVLDKGPSGEKGSVSTQLGPEDPLAGLKPV